MPNWTTNRIYFNGPITVTPEQVRERMDNSGFSELLAHGIHSARALFLLTYAGVIRVEGDCYGREPLRWLSKHGGARVDLNIEVDHEASRLIRKLTGVFDKELLTEFVAFATARDWWGRRELQADSVISNISWDQAGALFKCVCFDYSADFNLKSSLERWLTYYTNPSRTPDEPSGEHSGYHDMYEDIPPHCLGTINGFNGSFRAGPRTGRVSSNPNEYDDNIETYGTKWPSFGFDVGFDGECVYLDFQTAWSPPSEEWWDAISERMPEINDIYYAEQGSGFAGAGSVLEPGLVLWRTADLVFGEDGSVRPEWIKDKVSNYGG